MPECDEIDDERVGCIFVEQGLQKGEVRLSAVLLGTMGQPGTAVVGLRR